MVDAQALDHGREFDVGVLQQLVGNVEASLMQGRQGALTDLVGRQPGVPALESARVRMSGIAIDVFHRHTVFGIR